MTKDPTAAKRKREERERMRKEGWVRFDPGWLRPEWIPKIKKFIERLRK